MNNDLEKSYDELPYFSQSFPETNPAKLEAIATFLTLTPPDSKTANVLEIGCSCGGNLFPFALANPNANIVGVDLSGVQINKANNLKNEFGLKNIKFIQADISKLSLNQIGDAGKFDYIICHGVYSWVPDPIKEAILAKIKEFLSPNGIAYVSYNVYPGWKIKDVIRDFLLFGTKNITSEYEKVKKAREPIKFLKDYCLFCIRESNTSKILTNSDIILEHLNIIESKEDSYILHEFLEIFNDPIYFMDFAKKLEDNELAYLSDTNLDDLFKSNFGVEKYDKFINQEFTNRLEREQMLDFMTNKIFRKSLIVHKENLNNKNNIEISANELSKINITACFYKKDNEYFNIEQIKMKPEYNWLYQVFLDVFPQSINFADLAMLIENDEKMLQSAYFGFMEILSTDCHKLSTYPISKIEYEVKKSRLKTTLIPYFKYFSNTTNPSISLSDEFGFITNFNKLNAITSLLFDGENNVETITSKIIKISQNNCYVFKKDGKEIKASNKNFKLIAKEYVETIKQKLCEFGFLENY